MAKFVCEYCRSQFDRRADKRKANRFCSPACASTSLRNKPTDLDRVIVAADLREVERRATLGQNRRLLAAVRVAERIVGEAKEALSALVPVPPAAPISPTDQRARESAFLMFTDHHAGAKFTQAEMNGLNHYDMEEYARRLRYCVEKTVRLLCNRSDIAIEEVVVLLGGDMIDGLIHDSLERNADVAVADQVVVAAWLLAQALRDLARYFPQVRVICAPGNHGRLRKPHEMEQVTQNFDTLLYVLCQLHLKRQKNISFVIPRQWWNRVEVQGHGVLCIHGHVGIRGVSGMATYPGYGLRRSADNLQHIMRLVGQPVQYIVMGHYHSYFSAAHEEGMIVINGSIMGANPYSMAGGFAYRPAVQVLMTFHPKYGMTGQHLLTPQNHGIASGYSWKREEFMQGDGEP